MKWKQETEQKYLKLTIDPSTNKDLAIELIRAYVHLKLWAGVFTLIVIIFATIIFFSGRSSSEGVLEFTINTMGSFKGGFAGALIFAAIIFFVFGVNITAGKQK